LRSGASNKLSSLTRGVTNGSKVPVRSIIDDSHSGADRSESARVAVAADLETAADNYLKEHDTAPEAEEIPSVGSWAPELDEDDEVRDTIKAVWLGVGGEVDEGELGWQARALCAQTDPEAFFPEKGGSTRDAKRVCGACVVRSECLEYALSNDERFGIWGGLSERERRRLRKRAI